jgi:hypothetical protein
VGRFLCDAIFRLFKQVIQFFYYLSFHLVYQHSNLDFNINGYFVSFNWRSFYLALLDIESNRFFLLLYHNIVNYRIWRFVAYRPNKNIGQIIRHFASHRYLSSNSVYHIRCYLDDCKYRSSGDECDSSNTLYGTSSRKSASFGWTLYTG